ncbi:MAG: ATP synthase subunit C [Spirochaetota bacterium]
MDTLSRYFKSIFMLFIITCIVFFLKNFAFAAAEGVQSIAAEHSDRWIAYAAMGSVGLSCIASAYALAKIGSAAMGAMSEKPEIGGRALIFLGMAEGIAIYGLIIAIMLVNKI